MRNLDATRLHFTNLVEPISSGVYAVEGFAAYDFAGRGVTGQFLEDAGRYFSVFSNPAHFRDMYAKAFAAAGLARGENRRVLDIGTGGGNSLFAVYDLLGPVEALGVDISRPLLELCRKTALDHYPAAAARLSLLAADLFDLRPVGGTADLVTGSSILHHMLHPEKIVELALAAARPGGCVIFTEPFEAGHGALNLFYALALERSEALNAPLADFFRAMTRDYHARKSVGDIRDFTSRLDDKWFFTRGWFEAAARRAGCRRIEILPSHSGGRIFRDQFVFSFRNFSGGGEALDISPDWLLALLDKFDDAWSARQRSETCFTGIVVIER
jgi:SAM-dependent methyltransferase